MKKAYMKPELIYEDFSLAGSVIASCQIKSDAMIAADCSFVLPDAPEFALFNTDNTGGPCNIQPPADQMCSFDVSGESYNVFAS